MQNITRNCLAEHKATRMRKIIGIILNNFSILQTVDDINTVNTTHHHLFCRMNRPFDFPLRAQSLQ